ncbi:girdin isoform X2 [Hydra vulgaris]|uniref:Girdin isoform X2 n=1 Tax=Hydra vulgaris TaxID=6087 RepID=A0ABM4BSD7_HYDVU
MTHWNRFYVRHKHYERTNMAGDFVENNVTKETCQTFAPQQWRKTRCKHCFGDIIEHTKQLSKEESEEFINSCINGETCKISIRTVTDNDDQTQHKNKEIFEDKVIKDKQNDEDEEFDDKDSCNEDVSTPPLTNQRRSTRRRNPNQSLTQSNPMIRSSNSSLCSLTSEYTDGYSDYDYDAPSVTDDTDDYVEIQYPADDLNPETKKRMNDERRVSRSKILDLERELEGQQDIYRASEAAKDRQIKSLIREIEGLKLELSSVRAHENMLALKCRLELESKNIRIEDLEQQIKSLQSEIHKLSYVSDSSDRHHETLAKELERARQRYTHLEEENRSTEARLKLAEDLQQNDRELLEVLRNQLSQIEQELQTSQQCNKHQEDKLKLLDLIKGDLLKEQDKVTKLTKDCDNLRQKIKRRDRNIEDLEDDNVKLQQLKSALESQLAKKEFQMKKIERKLSSLQNDVLRKNREISDLTGEKFTLLQVRRLTDIKMNDQLKNEPATDMRVGENIFINTLEERLVHTESRVKELELENDNFLKEIRDFCENLNVAEKQNNEYKTQLADLDGRNMKLRQENKHFEKKIEILHRKLKKCEKEKIRMSSRQQDAEYKLTQYQEEEEYFKHTFRSAPGGDCCECGDSSRMLRLKLQSTEAKLSMIEGNKGYLEAKVKSLEKKIVEKDIEIQNLQDSIERDSGAPSQDNDRLDALEQENVLLQTRFDEVNLENCKQQEFLRELEKTNLLLESTIRNLNGKLEQCTQRLKGLEEANHILGREALRNCNEGSSTDNTLEELKKQNKELQEKIRQFRDVEELVELLEREISKEKATTQWYSDQNETMQCKLDKMADTICQLEERNQRIEKEMQQLNISNHDLQNDVKRLEQKLEIYSDLFGENSTMRSSLKRLSFQSDRLDEELLIGNALSPLTEEIKEKDEKIRELQALVLEKESSVNALIAEVELLEANLAAMVSEKIKRVYSKNETNLRKRDDLFVFKNFNISSLDRDTKNTDKSFEPSKELTVTTEEFYNILQEHEEQLKQKDETYKRNSNSNSASHSPNSSNEENHDHSIISTLLGNPKKNVQYNLKDLSRERLATGFNNKDDSTKHGLEEDMYEQLEQLEDLVKDKTKNCDTLKNTNFSSKLLDSPKNNSATSSSSSIDLSGLDNLLFEVAQRGRSNSLDISVNDQNSNDVVKGETEVPLKRPVMPSIITTKRKIIRLGEVKKSH